MRLPGGIKSFSWVLFDATLISDVFWQILVQKYIIDIPFTNNFLQEPNRWTK